MNNTRSQLPQSLRSTTWEGPVCARQRWPLGLALKHAELLAQSCVLEGQSRFWREQAAKKGEEGCEHGGHELVS